MGINQIETELQIDKRTENDDRNLIEEMKKNKEIL